MTTHTSHTTGHVHAIHSRDDLDGPYRPGIAFAEVRCMEVGAYIRVPVSMNRLPVLMSTVDIAFTFTVQEPS